MDGVVTGYVNEDGFEHAQSQWVLRAMRANAQFDVVVDGKVFLHVYLDGFTAA
ncbi:MULTISPECIES: hypothetical protein [Roseobacteraceae]|jgi:hypothetical protein|uniref:Uncharacterized protein n=1 Tax=Pseudosulfitobacter pseudonitzschiae TaxID=1402135 RepID=A0A221JYC8_9RHOB|nr:MULTISPECIES: hypothetical protein [Roseobacteraceae]ASM71736.1 hypothetical protein SULPSESMR1_00908 [Pseudosulfitobacter pseudonitzschiae]